ncbi:carotenoid ester lipase precursor [Flammula alnicola]|nr:carotenoid ester lipase precursor [Flammula alnicola]
MFSQILVSFILFTASAVGIPFAQPPVGDLRYQLPQTIPAYNGTHDATSFGPSCGQQAVDLPIVTGLVAEAADYIVNSIYGQIFPDSEDCLTLNVVKPATATSSSKLPVVVWIFGGGFVLGGTSMYDGATIVSRSIALGSPVVYVSMNYRLTGKQKSRSAQESHWLSVFSQDLGSYLEKRSKPLVLEIWLAGSTRALRWIQKYITQFGGDPTQVTIWGESAGAISVSLHMLADGGNPGGLFRAAFMESGAPIPVGDITNGQQYYDAIVSATGCSNAADTLACLRTVPYADLKNAINQSPGIFAYQAIAMTKERYFSVDIEHYVRPYAPFPPSYMCLLDISINRTDAQLINYIKTVFLPGTPDAQITQLAALYPSDITQGSPFDTGILNALTPQYKRIAAFQGDGVFQAPRRWLLQNTVPTNPNVWAFLSKRLKALPILGSVHASDLLNSYGGGEMEDYLIRFAATLNPNSLTSFQWPKYTLQSRQLLTFLDGLIPLIITADTYRQAAMNFVTNVTLATPV